MLCTAAQVSKFKQATHTHFGSLTWFLHKHQKTSDKSNCNT